MLAREVIAGTCPLKNWDNAVEQWIVRVNCVAAAFQSWISPDRRGGEILLIEEVCRGAMSYKEIKDRPVWPVKSWLTAQQQQLEQLAPERIELPNGRKAKITYDAARPDDRRAHPGSVRRGKPHHRPRPGAARHPGIGAESSTDPDHERPREILAGRLPEDQKRAAAQIPETRVALGPFGLNRVVSPSCRSVAPGFVCLMSNFFLMLRVYRAVGCQSLVPKMRIEGRKMTAMCEFRT